MATKAIPVVAAKVAATLADYPAYIKPSAMTGWGSLTTAEANSLRFYSDAGLTTELAREIVSADEIHVKVPSLTTTTIIYADYDGIRADYAVGATYGRNAVWSDYEAVYHMESDASDSTGNYAAGTVTGATNQAEEIGNGYDFDGANDKISFGRITGTENQSALTVQKWMRLDVRNSIQQILGQPDIGSANSYQEYVNSSSNNIAVAFKSINNGANWNSSNMTTGTRHLMHSVFDGTLTGNTNRFKIYLDGASEVSNMTYLGTVETTTTTSTSPLVMGERGGGSGDWNGGVDELRIRQSALSADWITTEYNNQSDVGAFWGTVTDAGGGVTANNSARRMLLMQM